MFGLKLPTDPRWVAIAEKNIAEVLIDHAWCEQKAASSAISMIVKYPHLPKLVKTMTELVKEEWSHFERVLLEIEKRGYQLGPQRVDEYALELLKYELKGGSITDRLTDKLLINGLIEARSCERFKLLSQEVADESLKEFYRELMISEAGHYRTFLDLAKEYAPEEKVKLRWNQLLEIEAHIINNLSLTLRGDRVHG